MPTLRETLASLYGAWRLAHLDPGAMAYFNASTEGVWRSFFAAVLVAPPYALMLALRYSGLAAEVSGLRYVAVESIAYVVSWVAYPVMMDSVARILGCRQRLKGYIAAYNWSLVLQNAVFLPIGILSTAGLVPPEAGEVLWLLAVSLILTYLWFIARIALEVPPFTAVGVVVLDVTLSLVISGIAEGMY